jgi:hypothetical protein
LTAAEHAAQADDARGLIEAAEAQFAEAARPCQRRKEKPAARRHSQTPCRRPSVAVLREIAPQS